MAFRSSASNLFIRNYKRSFNGFVAKLTERERERLANMKGVVSVFPSRSYQLQTTRSWDYRIIGARHYNSSSARDEAGHGTHTASTAAGNSVKDVSFYGLAQGTTRGGVPSARIAAYKVCNHDECSSEAILAAFDDAIADGVDIITISVGSGTAADFDQDAVSIGTFHAMKNGILTAQSAGNECPNLGTVSSVAPWILTVAASNTDRRIITKVVLGDGGTLIGSSVLPQLHRRHPAAPIVASFSSRGPNIILPEIIKPDISAPGVDILAAFSPVAPVLSDTPEDKRRVKYSILSGTSMSCPYAAGAAAYIRTFHPHWSPAAIKSSLMTTAWPMHNSDNYYPGEFAYGSGHINPLKAVHPGLVYKTSKDDYIKFLCSILDEARVRLISGDNGSCPTGSDKGSVKDLNYPSLAAIVTPLKSFNIKFSRTVKNVGLPNSTYEAKILPTKEVEIKVAPKVLSFKSLNEEKTFTVTVVGKDLPDASHVSVPLIWSDGIHTVTSPILVRSAHNLS
ncbi:unnamed protein product [Malus baccata var. baccata]